MSMVGSASRITTSASFPEEIVPSRSCWFSALALLIVAAARPRFGVYFEQVARRGADVFVVLDVSKSMTAEDVAPSRLEHAKSDIRDLLDRVVGDRVGLIVFAGKPVMKVPLTTDQGFFLATLDEGDEPRSNVRTGWMSRVLQECRPGETERTGERARG